MNQRDPHRSEPRTHDVELWCPECGQTFFVPSPEGPVSLARCPHRGCQRVAFVCADEATTRPGLGPVALDLEGFLCPPRDPSLERSDVAIVVTLLVLFLLIPIWMWAQLWGRGATIRAWILFDTAPAVVLALGAMFGIGLDLLDARRRRARVRELRRKGFASARLLPSAAKPGWGV
jgi:hypothetical protein